MKCLIFFVGVVLFQLINTACGSHEGFLACAKELGITEAMIKEGMEKNREKPEFRCLQACIMKKDGVLEPGNKINTDKLKPELTQYFGNKADAIIKAGEECAVQSTAIPDECDFVNAVDKCIFQKFPEVSAAMKI